MSVQPIQSIWEIHQRSIEAYLTVLDAETLLEQIEETKRSWMHHYGSKADLAKCAPLALLSAALFHSLTGIWAWGTEEHAEKCILECRVAIEAEEIRMLKRGSAQCAPARS